MAASKHEYPLSTNVSSPVQDASRRRNQEHRRLSTDTGLHQNGYARDDFVISDDDADALNDSDEASDDAFEDVRDTRKPGISKTRQLGPPITVDNKLKKLNATHRYVVDDFLIRAKKESEKVRYQKLRL